MSKIKNDGLDEYATAPFKQRQFRTAGIEGVKLSRVWRSCQHKFGGFFFIGIQCMCHLL